MVKSWGSAILASGAAVLAVVGLRSIAEAVEESVLDMYARRKEAAKRRRFKEDVAFLEKRLEELGRKKEVAGDEWGQDMDSLEAFQRYIDLVKQMVEMKRLLRVIQYELYCLDNLAC